ncbi:hypothetical protein H4R20_006073, partial [Coemansia guatemalensis]
MRQLARGALRGWPALRLRAARHSSIRAKSSAVTAWGAFVGQLATTKTAMEHDYSMETHASAAPVQISPQRLFETTPDTDIRISAVGAGMRHALIASEIVEDSEPRTLLVGFGLNRCYQLGRPWSNRSAANSGISMITEISGSVSQISCGREHSAMVVRQRDGQQRVLVCGSNAFGQLGLASEKKAEDERVLQRSTLCDLDELDKILDAGEIPVKVQCGLDHTVILTSHNRVFAMGWGADGQLGTGYTADSDRPVRVCGLDDVAIVDISSTTDFTLALSADNRVFYWGNAEYGQCMVGRKIDKVLVPMQVPFGKGRIKSIAAGGCHALLLTEAGQVYICGYGGLGLGSDCVSVLEPTLIEGLENIDMIYASTD